jgi:subtilisin family serine protease
MNNPLCISKISYFTDIQGIDSMPLYKRYGSLYNIIRNRISPEYQSFPANPYKIDEINNEITWFSDCSYSETPRILSDLQNDEKSRYESIKLNTVKHYEEVLGNLSDSVDAAYLRCFLKHIDDRFIYCFNNKVVLGVWGMKLHPNPKLPLGEIVKTIVNPVVSAPVPVHQEQSIEFSPPTPTPPPPPLTASSNVEESGINDKQPWWKRLWLWLCSFFAGRGWLKWLLWLILLLLLLWLLSLLLPFCRSCSHASLPTPLIDANNTPDWVINDPRTGADGGIYTPGNPYQPIPTPSDGYNGILPHYQGVLPPIEEQPHIIHGNPSIIGNRLNILMENEDKSILEFAKDFKTQYPDEKYKIVYYDDVVKRMQITMPSDERERLKQEIPEKFAPDYTLFVFDESLFGGVYIPDDPDFTDSDKSWFLNTVHAPRAWDVTLGSPSVTIAVVDVGFDLKHAELKDKVVMPYNVWLHSKEVKADVHGTHVAGTALAVANNGKGLCGIAPECRFMPVQVANSNGIMTTTSVLDGILYALYQGADVVNVSLNNLFTGINNFSEDEQRNLINNHFREEERLWNEIMKIADSHKSVIVVAAGNDNALAGIVPIQRPKNVVVVSAVNRRNQPIEKADFSNYGDYSTISAPGEDVFSCINNNRFASLSGTSMAAPIVAGGIALMKSLNKDLTAEQIICILQKSGVEAQGNIGKLIQIDSALAIIQTGQDCETPPPLTPSTGDVQIFLRWHNYNDLDLYCIEPAGNAIWFKNKTSPSGGQLEIDMNVEYPDSDSPIENIFWPTGSAPQGTYKVFLQYYKQYVQSAATPYTITVKYGNKTEEFNGTIDRQGQSLFICSFTLGSASGNTSTSDSATRQSLLRQREQYQKEIERIDSAIKQIDNLNIK